MAKETKKKVEKAEETTKIYCAGVTKEGKPCKRRVKVEGDFCPAHSEKK